MVTELQRFSTNEQSRKKQLHCTQIWKNYMYDLIALFQREILKIVLYGTHRYGWCV